MPGGTLPGNVAIQLEQVATDLVDPINVTHAADGSGRVFIVERTGTVRIIQEGQVLPEPFLDIASLVKTDFLEQGLLGLAFHPDYASNGQFYVFYSDYSTNGRHTLATYTVSGDDPNLADPDSGRILFSLADPYTNHNGGTIKFGQDGYLYIAIGDGGYVGDPYDNAQDLDSPLGKILRIDVNSGDPYGIPADNPFADAGTTLMRSGIEEPGRYHPEGVPEIWAHGLRNPWQFSFDRENGDIYIADVGQNYWEEVNVAAADAAGVNYGWDLLEGTHCYPADVTECQPYATLPVAEYDHADGSCSITGIGVYRGEQYASLNGVYFNSDYCSGKFWGLAKDDAGAWTYQELLDTELLVTGAGEDEAGELYVTACSCVFGRDYDPVTQSQGTVWRIVAADQVTDGATLAPTQAPDEPTVVPGEGTPAAEAPAATAPGGTPAASTDSGGTTQSVASLDISFDPAEFTVPADTDVMVSLPNEGALPHNFSIDELGIDVDIATGAAEETTINAPAAEYEYYCNVPGHKEAGMVGTMTSQ